MHKIKSQVSRQCWSSGAFGRAGNAPVAVVRLGLGARVGMVALFGCVSRGAAIGSEGSRSSHSAPAKIQCMTLCSNEHHLTIFCYRRHTCTLNPLRIVDCYLDFPQKLTVSAERERQRDRENQINLCELKSFYQNYRYGALNK